MGASIPEAQEAIRRCRAHRESGRAEAVLRSELDSRFRRIFPSAADQSWINHYTVGTEAHTKVGRPDGRIVSRFIDNLVGVTTIEYEADLRNPAKRAVGQAQVREHLAGLIRAGARPSQVRGVLSDTVEWRAYEATVPMGMQAESCTSDDVHLTLIEQLCLDDAGSRAAKLLITFVRKHLAREQSRRLGADHLALDLGLESHAHGKLLAPLSQLVRQARSGDQSVELATDLWADFVDFLERGGSGFRDDVYTDELYLLILARLLSANVLTGRARLSDDGELVRILNGRHFRDRYQLENMVERDYFGWVARHPYVDRVVPAARELQEDLYAYDYTSMGDDDLFGGLLAQLASRSQRQLLGQEPTPSWLARRLAVHCVSSLESGKKPRFLDICCGSGTIIAEVLKVAKEQRGLVGIAELRDVITGFDIDPLAVSLSKTTWVGLLSDEINAATTPIEIPVYHADSLFAATPVSTAVPLFDTPDAIDIDLDGVRIPLPHSLVEPSNADVFDRIVDWGLNEAREAQATGRIRRFGLDEVGDFLDGASVSARGYKMAPALRSAIAPAAMRIVRRMSELAARGRNGIWAFVLRNTYRPALLAGEFNGVVCNPPWLALSRIRDNPYTDMLTRRAEVYGVRPKGESFLHLELATIHLLHAVDRYLAEDAVVACLVPQSVLNGKHQERFRCKEFLDSSRAVPLVVDEVWEVEEGTFKIPGAALLGRKARSLGACTVVPVGALALTTGQVDRHLFVAPAGPGRSAWIIREPGHGQVQPITEEGNRKPEQGADLMPRTAVCIEIMGDGASGMPSGYTIRR